MNYRDFLEKSERLYNLYEIDSALNNVAEQLNQRFENIQTPVVVINILNGGLVTTAHLLLKLNFMVELDCVNATRYRKQTSGSDLEWKLHPSTVLRNATVLLIDDIYDEGITLAAVKDYCLKQSAKEVVTAVLLNKERKRKVKDLVPDYVALTVPDVYVYGFGLDYGGHYRNAPGIYSLSM